MAVEIKRNTWGRFRKKFNSVNQYRQATVSVKSRNGKKTKVIGDSPFLGFVITKKGRLIDGIDIFVGNCDSPDFIKPVLSIKEPFKVMLDKEEDGWDNCLLVESKDGSVASIVLSGESDPQRYHSFVEKVAYSISEQRGFDSGKDVDNWCEAEQKVKEAELLLVS